MKWYILTFALGCLILASCSNSDGGKAGSAVNEQPEKVSFASLTGDPDKYLNKDILVEGKVVHVCKHSGKKLFIVGDNPDIRLFINAGEEVPRFPMELLGSQIVVEGVITKLSGGEQAAEIAEAPKAGENCETEEAVASQDVLADIVMEYRSHSVK